MNQLPPNLHERIISIDALRRFAMFIILTVETDMGGSSIFSTFTKCRILTLFLATFYLVNDVQGYSKWTFFFVVFGANSIVIYMMAHLFDFRLIGNIIIGGFGSLFSKNIQDFIQAVGALMVMWLIMYWMYIKKTFIKI